MSFMDCPVGCGRQRNPGRLMCSRCWRRVPSTLRREVYQTWRAVAGTNDTAAFDAYDRARNQAIASVE